MKLDALRGMDGLVAAILVADDGLPVEMIGEGGEALAAEISSLRLWLERTSGRMGAGRVTRVSVITERMEIVGMASTNGYILAAALSRGQDARQVMQVLARLVLEVSDLPDIPKD